MTQPKDLPTFATDLNYSAGSKPWSAQPTKVKPPAGNLASGHVPEEEPPAEWENWVKNNMAEWFGQLIPALSTFHPSLYGFATQYSPGGSVPNPLCVNMGSRLGVIGNAGVLHRSRTGYDWAGGAAFGITGIVDLIAKPDARAVIWDSVGTATRYSTDYGATWNAGGAVVANLVCGTYAPSADLFVLAGTNLIRTSPDAVTWTARTPANSNSSARAVASPNEVLLLASNNTLQRSVDGISWTNVNLATRLERAAYNESQGMWLAWSPNNSHFYASDDGLAWSQVSTSTTGSVTDIAAFGRYWVAPNNAGAGPEARLTDDGNTFRKLNVGVLGGTAWTRALTFNGQCFLMQWSSGTELAIARSLQIPV